jgi:hypothetical protein
MVNYFQSAEIKIERAKWHLQDLNTKIDQFVRRGGAGVVYEIAKEFGVINGAETGAFTYREREPIPSEWSAIIGDILHNLRSSLDLIACDLHRITGGPPNEIRKIYYPFCARREDLPDTIRHRCLEQIGKEFLEIIEQTAPYRGGNDGLRALHDLNILDKHQVIVPTIAVVAIDWPVPITGGDQKFVTRVTNGQRLIMFAAPLFPYPEGSHIKAEFSIVFGDVDVFRGGDVVKQLQACLESIEVILRLFEVAAEKKAAGGVIGP